MTISELAVRGGVGVLNAGGRALRRFNSDPPALDAHGLRRAAERRAGLADLGVWPIAEPLERLLASYEREASLTTLGRITVRELLVSLLDNLLRLEAERAADPSIGAIRIDTPVFVTGLPRTGTTLLHGLLSADPGNRAPLTWEVMYPTTSAEPTAIEHARRRTAARLDWANRLAPDFKRIHPIGPDLPQECIAITAQAFMSIQFHTTHCVPSYQNWLERDSQDLGYAFHHRLLQHLERRAPGRRWVLKAPGHLFGLDALLRRYPDARVIQTHRDPLRVIASMASLATVLRRAFSTQARPAEIAIDWTTRWAAALERFLAVRDRAPSEHFLDIGYDAIERTPLETVERIYAFLGWPLTARARAAMERFLAANPKNKHGSHRYSLAEFGLDRDAEARRFEHYCERFAIPISRDVAR